MGLLRMITPPRIQWHGLVLRYLIRQDENRDTFFCVFYASFSLPQREPVITFNSDPLIVFIFVATQF